MNVYCAIYLLHSHYLYHIHHWQAFQQQAQAPEPEGYIILTDPMIDYETEDFDENNDGPINERTPRGLANEEPVELQGLDNLPLERSKYYAILNDFRNGTFKIPNSFFQNLYAYLTTIYKVKRCRCP